MIERPAGQHEPRAGLLERWLRRMARRRLRKEWESFKDPPEIRTGVFRRLRSHDGQQIFRSLIQVNIYRGAR